jgi:hypothetical protein
MKIETHHMGTGKVIRLYFHHNGRPYWLALFPIWGRQYVEPRHLVTIDGVITSPN